MKIVERNAQQIGKSLLISLPKEWTRMLKVHKGSKIKMMISEQGNLSIVPELNIEEKRSEESIQFDQYYKGRFFKAYFGGYEKITFIFKNPLKDIERKDLYAFIKFFINAQVIEETSSGMVVKCFRIDDLTIEECLKRMYFLSLGLFDEMISSGDRMKMKESRETIMRFYYLLIMQIRRYMSEGKFIEKGQISILKSMDYRMVAEKIHRLSELLVGLGDKANKRELANLKHLYSKSFDCFRNDEFEKSAHLLIEIKNSEKKSRDIKMLYRYAKDICMLTK